MAASRLVQPDRETELLLHGTAIAIGTRAALIRGPSGSGKSDLALRCLGYGASSLVDQPAVLVADDQVEISVTGDGKALHVSAPATIRGRIEVRGIGIMDVPTVTGARLVLVVDLVSPEVMVRMPEIAWTAIASVPVRLMQFTPFEVSAPLKLLLALKHATE